MADRGKAIARTLRAQGWEQGAVLDFDYHAFVFDPANPVGKIAQSFLNRWKQEFSARVRSGGGQAVNPPGLAADYGSIRERAPDIRKRVIIVSQTCDILADADDEPWVEVLRLDRATPEFLGLLSRGNSSRAFCVDAEERLVAQAPHRTRVDKGVLMARQKPVIVLPRTEEGREEFRRWLGRRFTRPALPDDLDSGFRRVLEDMLRETDSDGAPYAGTFAACSELRHRVVGASAPYRVDLLFLTKESPGKTLVARVDELAAALSARVDGGVVSELSVATRCLTDIRAADYLATKPFLFEYFTTTAPPANQPSGGATPPGSDCL